MGQVELDHNLCNQMLASLRNERKVFQCLGPFNTEDEVTVFYQIHFCEYFFSHSNFSFVNLICIVVSHGDI